MEQIYKWVDSLLVGGYTTSYNMLNEDMPNSLGIFLYVGVNDLTDLCGDTVYESINIHLQLNSEQGEAAMFAALANVRGCVEALESSSGNDEITIVSCIHKGPKSLMIGVNEHNLPVIVANLELKYELN